MSYTSGSHTVFHPSQEQVNVFVYVFQLSNGRTFIGCGRFRKRKVMIIESPCHVAGGLAAPAGVPVKKPSIARRRAAGPPDNPGERVSGASNSVSPPFPELPIKYI